MSNHCEANGIVTQVKSERRRGRSDCGIYMLLLSCATTSGTTRTGTSGISAVIDVPSVS